ncbi:MAG: hypothetical protein ACKOD9_11245 [Rubrivivax sp.]
MKPKTLAAALLTCTAPLLCQAGRPLQTEDAGILEAKTCEVEGAVSRVRVVGSPSVRDNALQLGCGVGLNSQVALALSRTADGADREQGLRLGGKTELWSAGGDEGAALTLAWGLSGARAAAGGWKTAGLDARAVLSMPAGPLTWHLNLGHERDSQARSGSTVWGVGVEHEGFGALAPMAELFGSDREASWWNLGLRYTIAKDKAYLDMSYGRQMSSGTPSLLTAGFKLVF